MPNNVHAQSQREPRFDASIFVSRNLTVDLWGVDGSYSATGDVAVFSTFTLVDNVDGSGWMADAGLRLRFPTRMWQLRASAGAGLRVKHLGSTTDRLTRLHGLTESRVSLPLGAFVPYFAVRFAWFDWNDVDSVWGLAVAW